MPWPCRCSRSFSCGKCRISSLSPGYSPKTTRVEVFRCTLAVNAQAGRSFSFAVHSSQSENDLPACAFTANVHRKTSTRVVFGEYPGDSEEMRHLPQEKDREQRQGHGIDLATSGCPTHQRGRSAWKGADERAQCRSSLQRRVYEDVCCERQNPKQAR